MGPTLLDRPGAYDRGGHDVFEMEGVDVVTLTKLVVSVQAKGGRPLWHLDYITVSGSNAYMTFMAPLEVCD